MINYNIISNLIDHYEELLSVTERYGYTNLRFFSSGREEEGVLSILAHYTQAEREFLFEDVTQPLSELLGTEVSLIAEGSRDSDSDFLRKEAEKAPLSDMVKTVHYFFDSIIPMATGKEPDENQRECMLKKWESKTRDMASLKSGNNQRSSAQEEDNTFESPMHEDTKRSPKNAPKRRSSASEEEGSSPKRQSPLMSRSGSPSSLWSCSPELSTPSEKGSFPHDIKGNIQFTATWVLEHPEAWDEALDVFSNLVEKIKSNKLVAEQQQRISAGGQ